jgi:hypothetical protein
MSAAAGPDIIQDGLVLCLDAGNKKSYSGSGTVWRDLAGSNNGTLTNGPTFNGSNGGSIVFDGIDDLVTTPLYDQGATGTLQCWFKATTSKNSSYFEGLIDSDRPGFYGSGLGINNLTFQIILNDQFWTPGVSFLLNIWYMANLTWTTTNAWFYLNGNLMNQLSYTQGSLTGAVVYYIGKSYANSRYFNGNISQALIYNRALTPTEIQQNYNATKGRFRLT